MFEYKFTLSINVISEMFNIYIKDFSPSILGASIESGTKVTIYTSEAIPTVQISSFNSYVLAFNNTITDVLNEDVLNLAKKLGRKIIDQFEITNMKRKADGLMGRIELRNIMKELHDTSVYICMVEGSLDTLAGILFGFPAEGSLSGEPPVVFEHVWQEDIDMIKGELLNFISGL